MQERYHEPQECNGRQMKWNGRQGRCSVRNVFITNTQSFPFNSFTTPESNPLSFVPPSFQPYPARTDFPSASQKQVFLSLHWQTGDRSIWGVWSEY